MILPPIHSCVRPADHGIMRPSYAGLRPRNNGDRGLGVGTRSALEKQGPQSPSHSSGILPPLG